MSENPYEEEEQAYQLLQLAGLVQMTSSLPRSGGILDQDGYTMEGLALVFGIQSKIAAEKKPD